MGKIVLVWTKDQISHNISLKKSLIQTKALTLLSSLKIEKGKEVVEGKSEGCRSWITRFKERSHLHNIREQGEEPNADVEAIASYAENERSF